jgi:hypothetical protein
VRTEHIDAPSAGLHSRRGIDTRQHRIDLPCYATT